MLVSSLIGIRMVSSIHILEIETRIGLNGVFDLSDLISLFAVTGTDFRNKNGQGCGIVRRFVVGPFLVGVVMHDDKVVVPR